MGLELYKSRIDMQFESTWEEASKDHAQLAWLCHSAREILKTLDAEELVQLTAAYNNEIWEASAVGSVDKNSAEEAMSTYVNSLTVHIIVAINNLHRRRTNLASVVIPFMEAVSQQAGCYLTLLVGWPEESPASGEGQKFKCSL